MKKSRTFLIFGITSYFPGISIIYLNFVQWPDFGIPKCPKMILDFQDRVKMRHNHVKKMMVSPYDPPSPDNEDPFEISPIIIHCSAGIGRTGLSSSSKINFYFCMISKISFTLHQKFFFYLPLYSTL